MFLRFHKVGDESIMFEFLDLRLFIGSSEVVNCVFISLGIGFWILVRTPVLTQTTSLPMMEQTFGALYISQGILTNNFNTLRLALSATERVSMKFSEN